MAHAVHPNYPERHEPGHRPLPNGGPVLKVNANQRYATDATTEVAFTRACEQAGVPWQVFVSRNNMPCGSTIGPITATRLGHGDRRRRLCPALDALGAGAGRRPRPRLPGRRPRRVRHARHRKPSVR